MKLTLSWAVAFTAVSGGAVFCAVLPWGDPCTAKGYAGQLCPIVLGIAASICQCSICCDLPSCRLRRWLNLASVDCWNFGCAIRLARGISGHLLYAVKTSWFDSKVPGAYLMAALFIGGIALLGTIGAVAAQWTTGRRRAEMPNMRLSDAP